MGNLCHQKVEQPKIYDTDKKKKILQSSLGKIIIIIRQ